MNDMSYTLEQFEQDKETLLKLIADCEELEKRENSDEYFIQCDEFAQTKYTVWINYLMNKTTFTIKDSKAAQRRVDNLTKSSIDYELTTDRGRKLFGYMYLNSYTQGTILSQAQGPNRAQRRQKNWLL